MWKIVISSNLNPPLKLFFYSPILPNNNMLLKIYYENIVIAFLNCHFLFFILFFSSICFFFFFFLFSLVFSPPHTYTHSYLHPPLFFLLPFLFLLDSRTSLSFSFSSSLFFYLIPEHSLALSVIRNEERGRERKNKGEILLAPPLIEGHRSTENRRSLCQAAPSTS